MSYCQVKRVLVVGFEGRRCSRLLQVDVNWGWSSRNGPGYVGVANALTFLMHRHTFFCNEEQVSYPQSI